MKVGGRVQRGVRREEEAVRERGNSGLAWRLVAKKAPPIASDGAE